MRYALIGLLLFCSGCQTMRTKMRQTFENVKAGPSSNYPRHAAASSTEPFVLLDDFGHEMMPFPNMSGCQEQARSLGNGYSCARR